MSKPCAQCGAPVDDGLTKCEFCGAEVAANAPSSQAPIDTPFTPVDTSYSTPDYGDITPNNSGNFNGSSSAYSSSANTAGYSNAAYTGTSSALPLKSKVVAGVLALLLGGLGIHKFYLGQIGKGILYILFCWTYIPAIISFIEGIMILVKSDADFEAKYNCRTK
jgi:TM2 domain-containing membrane protein YozV